MGSRKSRSPITNGITEKTFRDISKILSTLRAKQPGDLSSGTTLVSIRFQQFSIDLLPFSPFPKSIEDVFSKWKGYAKRIRPEKESELLKFTEDGLATITREYCDGYYLRTKTDVFVLKKRITEN
ncbi:hypothetical protein RF11_00970 [Thelohanellus kitauei]|uniref:Uncharacterized protein n=1 Tax=Thelohanellus kitauei TaxID=669202 RepID=A0A0C2MYX2_THEKT|nr:hypothetical protein RF11_00970 [Thelohanellus kitauei]